MTRTDSTTDETDIEAGEPSADADDTAAADDSDGRASEAVGTATPTLSLSGVTKRYGPTTALDDVSIAFEPGRFHGLIGPNGSGKTTLFALLAGLARPTSGRVDAETARVGYSFQEPRYYPDLTVWENLAVFRGFVDDPPPESWLDTLVEELRLGPAEHRRADELSGGFRKKLDLGLALVKRPQYLLLDEPLADVDDYSRRRIRSFLESYRAGDRTVVVSTHNVAAFADLFDRVTIIVDGEIRADGPPADDVVGQYRDALE
ncbi:ABC transporter ATP-binding protein [Halosolutus amylolyticus]|uniref:ABC transporter ATP-binding protein n=1 Tax=Halosolutus amylolyticus TaxID=2932267 RepID=A0ABD5PQN2_9EURY|nr:ABC transporter ATP-binding protein [Halosolutus amylolyticus]